jgi:hypothetical protein
VLFRSGNYTFELAIPLNSTDINDIMTSTNKTIGFTLAYVEWREDPAMPGSLGGIKGYYPASKNAPGQFLKYFIVPNVPIMHIRTNDLPTTVFANQSFLLTMNVSNYGAVTANNVSVVVNHDPTFLSNRSLLSYRYTLFTSMQSVILIWNFTTVKFGNTTISITVTSPNFQTIAINLPVSISQTQGNPDVPGPNPFNPVIGYTYLAVLMSIFSGVFITAITFFRKRIKKINNTTKAMNNAKTDSNVQSI